MKSRSEDKCSLLFNHYKTQVNIIPHIITGAEANEVEQLRQRVAQLEAELAQKNEELAQITKSKKSEQVGYSTYYNYDYYYGSAV